MFDCGSPSWNNRLTAEEFRIDSNACEQFRLIHSSHQNKYVTGAYCALFSLYCFPTGLQRFRLVVLLFGNLLQGSHLIAPFGYELLR